MENVTYRGKEIRLSSVDMKFMVDLKEGFKRFGSLAGAQKAVDKEIDSEPFKEFQVVVVEGYKPEYAKVVTVTGKRVEKKRSRNWGTEETVYYTVKYADGKTSESSGRWQKSYRLEDLAKVKELVAKKNKLVSRQSELEKKERAVDKTLDGFSVDIGSLAQ